MLSDYHGQTLEWVQPKVFDAFSLDLMAGSQPVAAYRLEKPLRMVISVSTDAHRLLLEPRKLRTQWVITEEGHPTPLATVNRPRRYANSVTTTSGFAYEWEAQGVIPNKMSFRVAGGPQVFDSKSAALAPRTTVTLTLADADIPEVDLLMLCGFAVHMVVLRRQD